MENYHIEKLISEQEINEKVVSLAKQITKDYNSEEVVLVGTLKGSIIFLGNIMPLIDNDNLIVDFISASSYGSGTMSSGDVHILKDLDNSIEGKNVLIIEDLIDTGNTISYIYNMLKARKPKTIKLCSLLDKPSRRIHKELKIDYLGFTIEDYFVVGYGMDFAERYRNLPYIGKVIFDEENNK